MLVFNLLAIMISAAILFTLVEPLFESKFEIKE